MTTPTGTVQGQAPAADGDAPSTPAARGSLRDRLRRVDNLLAVVSSVLLPLGFIVIVLGWYGAAHTPNLFEQIPYLISGGLLGLAMVIGAGLLYFGSWLAASAREQRAASAELLEVLQDIRRELQAPAARGLQAPPATKLQAPPATMPAQNGRGRKRSAAANGAPAGASFVATAAGSMLHRPDCAVVADRTDLHAVDPTTSGMRPCRLCDPLGTLDEPVHR